MESHALCISTGCKIHMKRVITTSSTVQHRKDLLNHEKSSSWIYNLISNTVNPDWHRTTIWNTFRENEHWKHMRSLATETAISALSFFIIYIFKPNVSPGFCTCLISFIPWLFSLTSQLTKWVPYLLQSKANLDVWTYLVYFGSIAKFGRIPLFNQTRTLFKRQTPNKLLIIP